MAQILEKLRCVSCGSTQLEDRDDHLLCGSCGTRYKLENGIPDMLLESVAKNDRLIRLILEFYNVNTKLYDEEWAQFEPWQVELRQNFIRQARENAPSPEVLDVACGPGRDLAYFASNGCRMTGVDLSYGQLNRARAKSQTPLVRADMRNLPFQDALFDALWCCVALQHLARSDAPKALHQMQRVLKPGGLMFISVLWGEGAKEVRREVYSNSIEYMEFYREPEISALVGSAGFSVADIVRREAFRGRKTSEVTGGVKTYIDIFARKR